MRCSEYSDMTFTKGPGGAQGYDEQDHAAAVPQQDPEQLACLFEKDDYKEIVLAIVPKATSALFPHHDEDAT